MAGRHKWPPNGQEQREADATYRACLKGCGIVRVTVHGGGRPHVVYERDGLIVSRDKTPVCEGGSDDADT